MMYLTYLYEFYDKLPDISIFTHGLDWPWHIDGALEYGTAYAIEHLDLDEVRRRQYMNFESQLAQSMSELDQHFRHHMVGRL
jgi:hypothetical protein